MIQEQEPKWIIGYTQMDATNYFQLGNDIKQPLNLKQLKTNLNNIA